MSSHRRRFFFFVQLMGIGAIIFIGLTSTPSSKIPYDGIFRRHPNDFLENDHNSSGETNLTDIFDLSPDWIPVDSRKLFLKSAYLDLSSKYPRSMTCMEKRAVRCVFHSMFARYDDPTSSTIADVEVINSPPDGDRCSKPNYYESHYLDCRMPKFSEGLALFRSTYVSVNPEPQDSKTHSAPSHLPINYIPGLRYQFSVCVPPLYDWTDTHSLVLFFEYYISQGADRFLVYNYSSSRATGIVLKHYEQLGLVRIVQWPRLPLLSDGSDANPRTFYHGEILMMNDCLWQLRAKTEFAAMVDLDEFIVPSDLENRTILELLKKLDRSDNDHHLDFFAGSIPIEQIGDITDRLSSDCACYDNTTGQYLKFCYRLPDKYGIRTIGKKFSCDHLAIVLYDLGLDEMDINITDINKTLKKLCGVEVRRFDFSIYPDWVKSLREYRWKPILITKSVSEYGVIWYMDTSVQLENSNISYIHALLNCRASFAQMNGLNSSSFGNASLARRNSISLDDSKFIKSGIRTDSWIDSVQRCDKFAYMQQGFTGHGIFSATNPGNYQYIPTDVDRLKRETCKMYEAGYVLVARTVEVVQDVLKWYVLCALEKDCMAPPGAKLLCAFKPDRYAEYANCHRYDQSVVSLLLANRNNFDSYYWISHMSRFTGIISTAIITRRPLAVLAVMVAFAAGDAVPGDGQHGTWCVQCIDYIDEWSGSCWKLVPCDDGPDNTLTCPCPTSTKTPRPTPTMTLAPTPTPTANPLDAKTIMLLGLAGYFSVALLGCLVMAMLWCYKSGNSMRSERRSAASSRITGRLPSLRPMGASTPKRSTTAASSPHSSSANPSPSTSAEPSGPRSLYAQSAKKSGFKPSGQSFVAPGTSVRYEDETGQVRSKAQRKKKTH